jgi:hypothetical protein
MPTSRACTSKRWRPVILIFEICLFAFILVLPQVALPDLTAHGGVSLSAAQARRFSLPAGVPLPTTFAGVSKTMASETMISETIWNRPRAVSFYAGGSRLALLCLLIC